MRRLVLALLSVLLVSCAMGPDYSRPGISAPESFRMAAKEGESIANLPWWELLRDEELQKLVRIALKENKDLMAAVASVEEYQARLYIARTDFAPQLTATGNLPLARMGGIGFPGFPSPFSHYGQGALSWELDIWGRVRRENEAARADLLAREENRRAVILQLVANVAQAYFDLRQLDMQLDIARRTLLAWEESVRIGRARLRQGLTNKLDVDQFEAERANAAARTAELERQMVQKENELSVLLGRNPAAIPRGRSLLDQALPAEVPPGLPSELLQRRPDVLQSEQQLAATTARIGVAKAERFPKITLTGILGVASPQLSRIVNPGQFGEVGPFLTGPLFNAQILGFQQQAVEAQARQAVAQYEQTILVAFREVEDALVAVRKTRDQTLAQEEQVTALRSALHLADLRYKGGLANYLDVLIAQRSLFDAELSLTATRRLHLVSIVQLYKALGGGWNEKVMQ
jgi:multidrug efflux system outer membrane protein